MKRFGILALLLLLAAHPAHAQSGPTACTAQTQTTLLNSFSDTAGPGTITPRNIRDFVCSASAGTASQVYTVNVTQPPYNAKCDGVTDDGPAFSAALQAIAATISSTNVQGGKLVGCNGSQVKLATTINATKINSGGFTSPVDVDFSGIVFLCGTTGQACIDMTGTSRTHFHGFAISGASDATMPSIGIQLVRADNGTTAATSNIFSDFFVKGWFTKFAVYLQSAETNFFTGCWIRNQNTSGIAALGLDGFDHWAITSQYVTMTRTPDTPISFTDVDFHCTEIAGEGIPAMWIDDAWQFRFRGYAYTTGNGPLTVLYNQGTGTVANNTDLVFDLHEEAYTHIQQNFLITGPNPNPVLPGIVYREHDGQIATSIFKADTGIASVTLPDLDVRVDFLANGNVGTPTVFDQPSLYTVSGYVYVPNAAWWVAPASFAGTMQAGTGPRIAGSPWNVALSSGDPTLNLSRTDFPLSANAPVGEIAANGLDTDGSTPAHPFGAIDFLAGSSTPGGETGQVRILSYTNGTYVARLCLNTLLVFCSQSQQQSAVGGGLANIQIPFTTGTLGAGGYAALNYSVTTGGVGGSIDLGRSKTNTTGTQAPVIANDNLGHVIYAGSDGAAFQIGATVSGAADGAVSAGIVPGRVVVSTANSSGTVTEGLRVDSAQATILAGRLQVTTPTTPATSASACTTGTIAWDTGFLYVCTATNAWKRAALTTW